MQFYLIVVNYNLKIVIKNIATKQYFFKFVLYLTFYEEETFQIFKFSIFYSWNHIFIKSKN